MVIEECNDGRFSLSWPNAYRADYYRVEVLEAGPEGPEVIWREDTESCQGILLPELTGEDDYTIRVNSVVKYTVFGSERVRLGEEPLMAATAFRAPRIVEFRWEPDTDEKVVSIDYEMLDADYVVFSHMEEDGTRQELQRMKASGRINLKFGEDGDFQIPKYGETCELAMNVFRREEGLEFFGAADIRVCIDREDLLGRDLDLTLEHEANNVVSLQWQETKGEYY